MKPRSLTLTRVLSSPGIFEFGRRPTDDQHAIEDLLLRPALHALAFERDANAFALGFHLHDARVEQDRLHHLADALGEDVHEIAIGAGQQARRHFDDGDGAAERRVHRSELEPDVAAADDEQRLRDVGQIERAGGIHHARIVHLQHRRHRRERSGRQNRVLERQRVLGPVDFLDAQRVRIDNLGETLDVLNLAVLDELTGAARQPLDDVVLELAELVEIDLRLAELDAPRLRVTRFVEHLRDVQQGLGRNAAAIDADAAGIHFGIDRARRSDRDRRARNAAA